MQNFITRKKIFVVYITFSVYYYLKIIANIVRPSLELRFKKHPLYVLKGLKIQKHFQQSSLVAVREGKIGSAFGFFGPSKA